MPETNPLTPEQEAELLFEMCESLRGDDGIEFLCVLDDYVSAANRVYYEKRFFISMYLAARAEGEDETVSAILREIQKGTTPQEIARQLEKGGLR